MAAQFIDIPESSPSSGRARRYLYETNQVVADPDLGASLEQINQGLRAYTNHIEVGLGASLEQIEERLGAFLNQIEPEEHLEALPKQIEEGMKEWEILCWPYLK
jgi:hypothetical protein